MNPPLRVGVGEKQRIVILGVASRLLQPEAQAIRRIGQTQQRTLPVANLPGQTPRFDRSPLQRPVRLSQSPQPLPVKIDGPGFGGRLGGRRRRPADQMIDGPVQKRPQHRAGRGFRGNAIIANGAGGGRHEPRQSFQSAAVFPQQDRRPAGPTAVRLFHQIGQYLLAVDQRAGQTQRRAPITQIVRRRHARRQHRPVPNGREQIDGIGGGQRQRGNFPGRQDRRLAGGGRIGHQRRGRQRRAAPAGKPHHPLAGHRLAASRRQPGQSQRLQQNRYRGAIAVGAGDDPAPCRCLGRGRLTPQMQALLVKRSVQNQHALSMLRQNIR